MSNKWLITCNTRRFDVISHFSKENEIVWRRVGSIHNSDKVFIYLAAPYKEIRYRALVLEADVNESEVIRYYNYAIPEDKPMRGKLRHMRLVLQEVFPKGMIKLESLQSAGLTHLRRQSRLPSSVVEYIEDQVNRGQSLWQP